MRQVLPPILVAVNGLRSELWVAFQMHPEPARALNHGLLLGGPSSLLLAALLPIWHGSPQLEAYWTVLFILSLYAAATTELPSAGPGVRRGVHIRKQVHLPFWVLIKHLLAELIGCRPSERAMGIQSGVMAREIAICASNAILASPLERGLFGQIEVAHRRSRADF